MTRAYDGFDMESQKYGGGGSPPANASVSIFKVLVGWNWVELTGLQC